MSNTCIYANIALIEQSSDNPILVVHEETVSNGSSNVEMTSK